MTYVKEGMGACKKLFAYFQALIVLIKAFYRGRTNNGFYEVSFTKIGRKWYCDVPGFPKELFEHTQNPGRYKRPLKQTYNKAFDSSKELNTEW